MALSDPAAPAVPPTNVRVLVAEGDSLARRALHEALSEAGLTVVGQAADSSQAVSLASRCAPAVILLDAALPPGGGLATMQAMAAVAPDTPVVLLGPLERDDTAPPGHRWRTFRPDGTEIILPSRHA